MQLPVTDYTITRFNQGDPAAFKMIFEIAYPAVYRLALSFVKVPQQAEDITEESFIKCWEKRGSIPSPSKLEGFLYRVTRNAALDVLKRRQMVKLHINKAKEIFMASLEPLEKPEPDWKQQQLLEAVLRAIDSLPRRLKEIVHLSFVEELPNPVIKALLRKSEKTIRNQKTVALKKIRDKLNRKI